MELKAKRDAATLREHTGTGDEEEGEEEDEGEEEGDEREALGVLFSNMMGWKMNTNRERERACPGSWRPGGRDKRAKSLPLGRVQNHRDNRALPELGFYRSNPSSAELIIMTN